MNITTAIVHDHRCRAKRGTEGMLEVRITHNRKHVFISTGIKVLKGDFVAGRIVNRLDADILNERLAIIYKKVGDAVNAAIANGGSVDAAEIRRQVFDVKEVATGAPVFMEWIAEQIPLLDISEGTRKHYRTTEDRLNEFGQFRTWNDITAAKIYEFDAFLHGLRKPQSMAARLAGLKPVRLSDAGIYTYHKNLKALLNRARRMEKIMVNPYDLLRGQFKKGEKESVEFLTEEEMQRILALDLPLGSVLDATRDLFVFQMLTGMAYSDAESFDFRKCRFEGGSWRLNGRRCKNGVRFVSQLLPPVLEVLEKYNGNVPQIDNADYNHHLKVIGSMAGITTRMHSHLARHSFATFMLNNDVKIENIKVMLGHKSIVTTQRYAKTLSSGVHNDFDRIKGKFTDAV